MSNHGNKILTNLIQIFGFDTNNWFRWTRAQIINIL